MANAEDYNYADCSNCRKPIPMTQASQALILRQGEATVAVICRDCQQAKKIQITVRRLPQQAWEYYQFFAPET
jgi:RNase P subunit RPR2